MQVVTQNIPASLVKQVGRAYERVRDDVDRLGMPMTCHQLRPVIMRIHSAIRAESNDAQSQLSGRNREVFFDAFWRIVLPANTAAEPILEQLEQKESALRQLGEGSMWQCKHHERARPPRRSSGPAQRSSQPRARRAGASSQPRARRAGASPQPPAQRTGASPQPRRASHSSAGSGSLLVAKDYAAMINSLAKVLCELHGRPVNSVAVKPPDKISFQSVAMIHSVGAYDIPQQEEADDSTDTETVNGHQTESLRASLQHRLRARSNAGLSVPELEKRIAETRHNDVLVGDVRVSELASDINVGILLKRYSANQQGVVNQELLKSMYLLACQESFDEALVPFWEEEGRGSLTSGMAVKQDIYLGGDPDGSVVLIQVLSCPISQRRNLGTDGRMYVADLDPTRSEKIMQVAHKVNKTTGEITVVDVAIQRILTWSYEPPQAGNRPPAEHSATGTVTVEEVGSVFPMDEARDEQPRAGFQETAERSTAGTVPLEEEESVSSTPERPEEEPRSDPMERKVPLGPGMEGIPVLEPFEL